MAFLQSLVEQRRSHVRFATPSGLASYFTSSLATLRAAHPQVSLEIMSGARSVDLQKGEADLALRVGPIADPSLVARKIGEVGWALYASSSYLERTKRAVNVDDLTSHECAFRKFCGIFSGKLCGLQERRDRRVVARRRASVWS